MQWPTVDMLKSEYNMGWLDDEGLAAYIDLGLLSTDQFNAITGKTSASSSAQPQSGVANSNSNSQAGSSSFNPVK